MDFLVRDAAAADLPAINDIYNHYVGASTCTYQLEHETLEARQQWWREHEGTYPVLVGVAEGEVAGWASLSQYSRRRGYRFTAENSVYIRHDRRGQGLGRALLAALLDRGKAAGLHTVVALIAADQPSSIRLHASLGFVEVGRLREVGFKFDRWLDTVFMQRML